MPNSNLRVPYGSNSADQAALAWRVRLAQEPIPENSKDAQLGDLVPMWNAAIMGKSATTVIYDNCPYATMTNGVLTVSIFFYVFTSSPALPYRLNAGFGDISPAELAEMPRSFDVLLTNTDRLQLDDQFTGTMETQMPIFSSSGEEIAAEITLSDGVITASEPCTTVLRMNGTTPHYIHTLTMQLQKESADEETGARTGLSVTNMVNHVTATWIDEHGAEQKTTMNIEIPPCVSELLEACEEDILPGEDGMFLDDTEDHLIVYYNTCTGEVIEERIVEAEVYDE